ncbi:MAG: DUF4153 domain-containing protein [Bacteroidota bacterium]|jgi:hypothetical protein|nr:DUF4153 domain-containing protein [Saprospiraceae bacterium]
MKQLPSLKFLADAFIQATVRFPVTIVSAISTVAAFYVLINEVPDNNPWAKLALTGVIGVPLSLCLKIYSETRNMNFASTIGLQMAGVAALAAYWYWFPDVNAPDIEYRGMPRHMAIFVTLHLICTVIPYTGRGSIRDFWIYNRTLLTNLVLGAIFSAVLFIGLSLALASLNALFDLNLDPKNFVRLFVFLVCIFNTSYFLFHFPKQYVFDQEETEYNAVFKNLGKYILIPVVGLYFIILYTYTIKIGLNWELPRGWVGSLVLGFSVAGILTYLLNYYLKETNTTTPSALYHKWLWPVLTPMTLLLFIAIYRRIDDYGVTETRFLVALLGMWMLINCLYFIISRKDDIRFIPGSLAVFALIWIVGNGPVSDNNQKTRLLAALQKAGRMENGSIRPDSTAIDSITLDQLRGAAEYFGQRGSLRVLDPYLPVPADSINSGDDRCSRADHFMQWLGVPENTDTFEKLVSLSLPVAPLNADVSGYNRMTLFSFNNPEEPCSDTTAGHNCFALNKAESHIVWNKLQENKHIAVDSFSMTPLRTQWNTVCSQSKQNDITISSKRTTLSGNTGQLGVIVASLTAAKGDSLALVSGQFYLLYNDR